MRALPLLDDPGPGVPAVYGAPLALLFSGALVEATEAFTRIIEWAHRHGSFLAFVQASHLRAGAWWRRGNLAEAEADAANAAEHRQLHDPPRRARARSRSGSSQRRHRGRRAPLARLRAARGPARGPRLRRHPPPPRPLRGRRPASPRTASPTCSPAPRRRRAWGIRTPAHSTWRSDAVTLLTTLGRGRRGKPRSRPRTSPAPARSAIPRPLGIALRAAAEYAESVDVLRAEPRPARARALPARARRRAAPRQPARRRPRAAARGRRARRRASAPPRSRPRPTTSSSPPAPARAATRSRAAAT